MPNLLTRCPLCDQGGPFGAYNPAPVACHSYETMPEGSRLEQCPACRLILLNPQPTPEESLAYEAADEQWYPTENLTEQDRTSHEYQAQWALRFIARFQPLRGRLLDIGSNRGFLLDAARRAGYQAQGVEPTTRTAEFSRREFGADVFIGLLADAPFAPASFDTITLWHVLEHIPAIPSFLCAVADLLRPGGFLFVQVPYLDYWPRPVHFNYFDCDLIVRLLREAGLSAAAAEITAGGFLTVAAIRGEAQTLPTEADALLWKGLALEHQETERSVNLLTTTVAGLEQQLAAQAAHLAVQAAQLAAQEADYRQALQGLYQSLAQRPSSRLLRALRHLLRRP